MRAFMRRLESGRRWWVAEVAFRIIAVALLALGGLAASHAYESVNRPPPHEANVTEFALAALAVTTGLPGWACLIEGPGLFRLVSIPTRHRLL